MTTPALIPLRGRDGSVRAYALVDQADYATIASHRWRFHKLGYAIRGTGSEVAYMHRELLGLSAGDERQADHINRNKLDNRRSNLRTVTTAENSQNLTPRRGTSEHRGVCWDRRLRKWKANGAIGGKSYHIGVFASEEDAAEAARAWREEHLPYATEEALA